jgi:hypothetical protein
MLRGHSWINSFTFPSCFPNFVHPVSSYEELYSVFVILGHFQFNFMILKCPMICMNSYMSPQGTGIWDLKLLVYVSLHLLRSVVKSWKSYKDMWMRSYTTSVWGLELPLYLLVNLPPKTTSQILGPLFNNKKLFFFNIPPPTPWVVSHTPIH